MTVQQTQSSLEGKARLSWRTAPTVRCGLGPAPLAEVKATQGWGQAGTVLVGLDLNTAVKFEWLIFVCIQGHDTGMMLALDKHPNSNVTGFLALLSISPSMLLCIWPH